MNRISFDTGKQTDKIVEPKIEPDGSEVYFKMDGYECLTECPFGVPIDYYPTGLSINDFDESYRNMKIHVGSMACCECSYFRAIDLDRKFVLCEKKMFLNHGN